jgi:hypothetical protein
MAPGRAGSAARQKRGLAPAAEQLSASPAQARSPRWCARNLLQRSASWRANSDPVYGRVGQPAGPKQRRQDRRVFHAGRRRCREPPQKRLFVSHCGLPCSSPVARDTATGRSGATLCGGPGD